MSLIVVFESNDPKYNKYSQKEWHIGEEKTFSQPGTAIRLRATGDELEHIRTRFTGIPNVVGNFTIWHAPFAQFIWDNL